MRRAKIIGVGVACGVSVAALGLVGCGKPQSAEASTKKVEPVKRQIIYSVTNRTGKTLTGVAASGTEVPISWGTVDNGDTDTLKDKKLDTVPKYLELHWTDHRKQQHFKKLNLWKALGKTYTGPVKMTIDRTNKVRVSGG